MILTQDMGSGRRRQGWKLYCYFRQDCWPLRRTSDHRMRSSSPSYQSADPIHHLRQHGILNSVATKWLARFTVGFVFINVGTTILIIIVLLACTGKDNMHSARYATC